MARFHQVLLDHMEPVLGATKDRGSRGLWQYGSQLHATVRKESLNLSWTWRDQLWMYYSLWSCLLLNGWILHCIYKAAVISHADYVNRYGFTSKRPWGVTFLMPARSIFYIGINRVCELLVLVKGFLLWWWWWRPLVLFYAQLNWGFDWLVICLFQTTSVQPASPLSFLFFLLLFLPSSFINKMRGCLPPLCLKKQRKKERWKI